MAPPGSLMVLGVGFEPARIDLGAPLGHLYIHPALLVTAPWNAPVPPSGIAELAIDVPVAPVLRQSQIHFQNIVVPPAPDLPWPSTSVAPIIF